MLSSVNEALEPKLEQKQGLCTVAPQPPVHSEDVLQFINNIPAFYGP